MAVETLQIAAYQAGEQSEKKVLVISYQRIVEVVRAYLEKVHTEFKDFCAYAVGETPLAITFDAWLLAARVGV